MSLLIFFILAAIAVTAALMVVNTRSPVSAALYLILVMCCLAGLFALMGAIFLAALQVIVYAGAIMVLFLFVIMLLNLRRDEFGYDPHVIQKYLGFILVAIIMVQAVFLVSWSMRQYDIDPAYQQALTAGSVAADSSAADYSAPQQVAQTLFTRFAYPFEVTSVLLLAAIIGAVVIARRRLPSDAEGGEES